MRYYLAVFILMLISVKLILKESQTQDTYSIYNFELNDINGQPFSFRELKGKSILLVNIASKCGFVNQLEDLEHLHQMYTARGLVVIGVPSNDFGNQEPGSSSEIKAFCQMNYNVTFPLLEKSVIKGKDIIPLYEFLTNKKIHPKTGGRITWNFNKFLIDSDGYVRKRYSSFTKPSSKKIIKDVEKLLEEKEIKNEK